MCFGRTKIHVCNFTWMLQLRLWLYRYCPQVHLNVNDHIIHCLFSKFEWPFQVSDDSWVLFTSCQITHPAGCMSQFIRFFGEQIMVLWKFALLRKRILIFSPPPVGVVCYRGEPRASERAFYANDVNMLKTEWCTFISVDVYDPQTFTFNPVGLHYRSSFLPIS